MVVVVVKRAALLEAGWMAAVVVVMVEQLEQPPPVVVVVVVVVVVPHPSRRRLGRGSRGPCSRPRPGLGMRPQQEYRYSWMYRFGDGEQRGAVGWGQGATHQGVL